MDRIAKHIIFKGQVQGVGFRYTTHRVAARYDVTGFVRNLPDGTVETLVQGQAKEVDACLDDIQEAMAGYIRDLQIKSVPVMPQHGDFRITF